MTDEREVIMLYDEDNNLCEFEVLAVLDVDDSRYAILLPVNEEGEEEEEAYILRVEQDEDGEDILVGIEDEDELNTVIEAYQELLSEEE